MLWPGEDGWRHYLGVRRGVPAALMDHSDATAAAQDSRAQRGLSKIQFDTYQGEQDLLHVMRLIETELR